MPSQQSCMHSYAESPMSTSPCPRDAEVIIRTKHARMSPRLFPSRYLFNSLNDYHYVVSLVAQFDGFGNTNPISLILVFGSSNDSCGPRPEVLRLWLAWASKLSAYRWRGMVLLVVMVGLCRLVCYMAYFTTMHFLHQELHGIHQKPQADKDCVAMSSFTDCVALKASAYWSIAS